MAAENGASRLRLRSNLCWQLTAEHRSENARDRRFAARSNRTMISGSRRLDKALDRTASAYDVGSNSDGDRPGVWRSE